MLFFFALTLVVVRLNADWVEPWYCHGLDCPVFNNPSNLTINGVTIEMRNYEQSLWAATLVENTDLEEAENIGFNTIFDYISGANVANEEIPMTAPVRTYVQPAQGPYCTTNFT